MGNIYIVYVTDAWHSFESSNIIGVCTTFPNCMKVIRAYIKEFNRSKLTEDEKFELKNYKQTQGRDDNYLIEEVEKNVLL